MDTPDEGSSQNLAEVIARWQQQLLDLTKRNRLLYFRSGRSAVRLTSHTPDQISKELLGQASGLSFDYAERRQTRKPIFVDPLSDEVEVADLEPDVVKGALEIRTVRCLISSAVLNCFSARILSGNKSRVSTFSSWSWGCSSG